MPNHKKGFVKPNAAAQTPMSSKMKVLNMAADKKKKNMGEGFTGAYGGK